MAYEIRLERKVAQRISDWLRNTYREQPVFLAALTEYELALGSLAADPKQAVRHPGLFENRPVFLFEIKADGITRTAHLCFYYDPEDVRENRLVITAFAPVQEGDEDEATFS